MRKYIFNTSVIGAIVGAFGIIQASRKGPRDWRLVLMWISWALTVALAVGSVQQDDRDARELDLLPDKR